MTSDKKDKLIEDLKRLEHEAAEKCKQYAQAKRTAQKWRSWGEQCAFRAAIKIIEEG